MKILRIATSLNYGGIEKVFELHAKYHDKSYDLIFIALSKGGSTQQIIEELGYRVIVLNLEKTSIPSVQLIQALLKVFRQETPDVVHAAGAEANFHVPIAAKLVGIKKIICEEIGIPNHSWKAKAIFRLVYKSADKVIAISKAVENYLITSKEVPLRKVSLIYNPVNETIQGQQFTKEGMLFTVVARLEPVKNLSLLIETFAKVLEKWPEARLNIIGDGSLRNELQAQINTLGHTDKINLLGFMPNPHPQLAKSTYFILPSLFEGFGLACIEAIQARNLVICTNSGGIPEFLTDRKQGFLFDPKSVTSILSAIESAVSLPTEEREKVVDSAQERVKTMFSPKKYIEQLGALYHR